MRRAHRRASSSPSRRTTRAMRSSSQLTADALADCRGVRLLSQAPGTALHILLEADQILADLSPGIAPEDPRYGAPDCIGGRSIGHANVHACTAVRSGLEAHDARTVDRGVWLGAPRDQLIGLISGDRRIPLDRGARRPIHNPVVTSLVDLAHLPHVIHEARQLLGSAPLPIGFARLTVHLDRLLYEHAFLFTRTDADQLRQRCVADAAGEQSRAARRERQTERRATHGAADDHAHTGGAGQQSRRGRPVLLHIFKASGRPHRSRSLQCRDAAGLAVGEHLVRNLAYAVHPLHSVHNGGDLLLEDIAAQMHGAVAARNLDRSRMRRQSAERRTHPLLEHMIVDLLFVKDAPRSLVHTARPLLRIATRLSGEVLRHVRRMLKLVPQQRPPPSAGTRIKKVCSAGRRHRRRDAHAYVAGGGARIVRLQHTVDPLSDVPSESRRPETLTERIRRTLASSAARRRTRIAYGVSGSRPKANAPCAHDARAITSWSALHTRSRDACPSASGRSPSSTGCRNARPRGHAYAYRRTRSVSIRRNCETPLALESARSRQPCPPAPNERTYELHR